MLSGLFPKPVVLSSFSVDSTFFLDIALPASFGCRWIVIAALVLGLKVVKFGSEQLRDWFLTRPCDDHGGSSFDVLDHS